jgi:hypothetical protein
MARSPKRSCRCGSSSDGPANGTIGPYAALQKQGGSTAWSVTRDFGGWHVMLPVQAWW